MNRDAAVARLRAGEPFDLLVIGGGATGLGIAIDAASRGHSIALVERGDFGCGTSSRSTKLVHGGVRYLEQGNLRLVREALAERAILLANAAHLAHPLPFVLPCHGWWERAFYGTGLGLYDLLAVGGSGSTRFRASRGLSREEVFARCPGLARSPGGRSVDSGIVYEDGQFDDARLAVNLAQTADGLGALVANRVEVVGLLSHRGRLGGAEVRDVETGEAFEVRSRSVVNATGAFCDAVRRLDDPVAPPIVAASQGIHLVLPRRFLPGDTAVIVPKTPDGRVMFAIPWRDRVVVGTTDTPVPVVTAEPIPQEDEIAFLLELCGRYLATPPTRDDILSIFAGIRPLVAGAGATSTKSLSRDHTILVSSSGMLTITGGKWTTYRRMAEDAVNRVEPLAGLRPRACVTRTLRVHACPPPGRTAACPPSGETVPSPAGDPLAVYGDDAEAIRELARAEAALASPIHPRLATTAAQVAWAVRREMARTVDDVLTRRTRDLVTDARAAIEAAPRVAAIMAGELGRDDAWQRSQVAAFGQAAAPCLP